MIGERPAAPARGNGRGIFAEVFGEREVMRFYAGMILWWIGLWMVSAFFIIAYGEIFRVSTGKALTAFFIFNVSFVASALPAGLLGVRYGLKRINALGLGLLAVGLACAPFIGGYTASMPFLVVAGASYSAVLAVSYPFFLRLLPPGTPPVLSVCTWPARTGRSWWGPRSEGWSSTSSLFRAVHRLGLYDTGGSCRLLSVRGTD